MKTLITKTGKFVDTVLPETRTFDEVLEDLKRAGVLAYTPESKPIELYIEINISDETFDFIEQVANVEVDFYGDKTYVINKLRFKLKSDVLKD